MSSTPKFLRLIPEVSSDMTTEVLERPELKEANTGPEMFHYVDRAKIGGERRHRDVCRSTVRRQVPRDEGREAGLAGLPACKEIYESFDE